MDEPEVTKLLRSIDNRLEALVVIVALIAGMIGFFFARALHWF
jgi:hypothetical protein